MGVISLKDRLDVETDLLALQFEKTSNNIDVDTQIYYLIPFLLLLKISVSDLIEIADAIDAPYMEEPLNNCSCCKDKKINKRENNHKIINIESYMNTVVYVVVNTIETMVEENPKLSSIKHDHLWNTLLDEKYYCKNYEAMNWFVDLKELDSNLGIAISLPTLRKRIKSNLSNKRKAFE